MMIRDPARSGAPPAARSDTQARRIYLLQMTAGKLEPLLLAGAMLWPEQYHRAAEAVLCRRAPGTLWEAAAISVLLHGRLRGLEIVAEGFSEAAAELIGYTLSRAEEVIQTSDVEAALDRAKAESG